MPALELQAATYREESMDFFSLIDKLAIMKATLFVLVFLIVYFFVLIAFLDILKVEIWQTHSILNMIPDSVLEHNKAVQEQVWRRRGVK